MSPLHDEWTKCLLALQFLTRLPVPGSLNYTEQAFADTPRYYPLVGAFIGLLCALVYLGASQMFDQALAVVSMAAFGILLTGAFHEDGLADTFDGIGGGLTREQCLEIMKDSRLGTYGTLAIVLMLLGKITALISLPTVVVFTALVAGHGLSRLSSVLVMKSSDYMRDHGTGKPVSSGINRTSLLIAIATGLLLLITVALVVSLPAAIYSITGLLIGHALMRRYYTPTLRGYTGDTLGAVQQASELGFYLGLAAWV
jgi:adenosylcobinamide-GDP ribazoletransferase